eukprot:scaffold98808_cov69-Phaeocystis_antarctica.AAC.13
MLIRILLDEVDAVLHDAKLCGPLPLARSHCNGRRQRAPRESPPSHAHSSSPATAQTGSEARATGRRGRGSRPRGRRPGTRDRARRKEGHRARARDVRQHVLGCDRSAVVGEAGHSDVTIHQVNELLVGYDGSNRYGAMEAGHGAQVASEDAHLMLPVTLPVTCHHQLLIVARDHRQVQVSRAAIWLWLEQVLRKVERHSCQVAPDLVSCLPTVSPLRAHGGCRAILQLQRRQQVRQQIAREQHPLDHPLVRGEYGVSLCLDFGRRLASCESDFQQLRARELVESRQTRGGRHQKLKF